MSSSKYVPSAVQNIQEYLAALPGCKKIPNGSSAPCSGAYNPALDESPELDPVTVNFYQSQIGILRWCVELRRIGIITKVSMLSTYLCLSLERHLDSVFRVFAYLAQQHHNAMVVFDPTYPAIDIGGLAFKNSFDLKISTIATYIIWLESC
jgi:hypothetical protein